MTITQLTMVKTLVDKIQALIFERNNIQAVMMMPRTMELLSERIDFLRSILWKFIEKEIPKNLRRDLIQDLRNRRILP